MGFGLGLFPRLEVETIGDVVHLAVDEDRRLLARDAAVWTISGAGGGLCRRRAANCRRDGTHPVKRAESDTANESR